MRVIVRVLAVALFALLVNCASTPNKPLQSTTNARDYKLYRDRPCNEYLVMGAYARLLKAEGCSECALYYLRCSEPSDLKKQLRKLKSRSWEKHAKQKVQ